VGSESFDLRNLVERRDLYFMIMMIDDDSNPVLAFGGCIICARFF